MESEDSEYSELLRRFVRGFLDVTIMRMLLDEPLWGYKLMNKLIEKYNVKVGPPVIYPLLDTMEEGGLIESEEVYSGKRKRKVYHVTPRGEEKVRSLEHVLTEFLGA